MSESQTSWSQDQPEQNRLIRTILVANRGEIARRVFRTCRSLGIGTVAVFSDEDRDAPFVAESDLAVRLPGRSPARTYLRGDLIIEAALAAGADAIHPGYGFLSENADFATAVIEAGLAWIGPEPDTIREMGAKMRAKEIMEKAGVPILSVDPERVTQRDLPLLVKASAGGGGRGMRVVRKLDGLAGGLAAAAAEAQATFGDATVFVEPYLPTARHIEVQVLADRHGSCWVVGDRDCSVQRRHQKVIEEAPAPRVSDAVRRELHRAAHAAVEAVGYVGAGTVEFLVADADRGDGRVYFLEMNTRLQVEHPVTECTTETDLVRLQIFVAEGGALPERDLAPVGHAIEVRLYAEDPSQGWQPQTGTLRSFSVPAATAFANPLGGGIRVDSAVEAGSTVGIHYDSMLAKVVAHAPTRTEALRMLQQSLKTARIHGLVTNRELLLQILGDDDFIAARLSTDLLEKKADAWSSAGLGAEARRRYAAAAALSQACTEAGRARVLSRIPTAFRNLPSQARSRVYECDGVEETIAYRDVFGRLDLVGERDIGVDRSSSSEVTLVFAGVHERYAVRVHDAGVDVDGPSGSRCLRIVADFVDPTDAVAEGSLLAPMPGTVVDVLVAEGDIVESGQRVLVLEAMKMQHTVVAPHAGAVSRLSATAGQQVDATHILAVIDGEVIATKPVAEPYETSD